MAYVARLVCAKPIQCSPSSQGLRATIHCYYVDAPENVNINMYVLFNSAIDFDNCEWKPMARRDKS